MKKTILKYSNLLVLLSAPFISSQTFALQATCELDVNTPGVQIDPCSIGAVANNLTYNLIGFIDPGSGINGIEFINGPNTLNFTGNIGGDETNRDAIYFNSTDNNVLNMIGNLSTTGNSEAGIHLSSSSLNTIVVDGNISSTNGFGFNIDSSGSNNITMTGNIVSKYQGIWVLLGVQISSI